MNSMDNGRKKHKGLLCMVIAIALTLAFAGAVFFSQRKTGEIGNAIADMQVDDHMEKETDEASEDVTNPDDMTETDGEDEQKDGEDEQKDGAVDNVDPGEDDSSRITENKSDDTDEAIASDDVTNLLSDMTLREKICQMVIVHPSKLTGVSTVTVAGETTKAALEKYPVGGLIYDATNFVSVEQTKTMLDKTQSYSKIPLIMTLDEEGGRVNRLMHTLKTTYVRPMYEYKDQGYDKAKENAFTIAKDIKEFGFNMDLAPVADVWSNPANTVIGDRAYSDDFEQAAELIPAAVEGFHDGGVACVLKHFPGHGDTSEDSHYGSAYVYKSLDDLEKDELMPFRAGIEAGADCVMMGHLIVADMDSEPALFSYRIVTELLREEMGFTGVIITDALEMKAMTDHYGNDEIVVNAVKAGVDILLMPADIDAAINALSDAVESGDITEERIDESVARILTLKEKYILQPAT